MAITPFGEDGDGHGPHSSLRNGKFISTAPRSWAERLIHLPAPPIRRTEPAAAQSVPCLRASSHHLMYLHVYGTLWTMDCQRSQGRDDLRFIFKVSNIHDPISEDVNDCELSAVSTQL